MLLPSPDVVHVIETNASLLGWGVVSEQTCSGGLWSEEERNLYINLLELMAGSFGVKIFTDCKGKENYIHVKLRMDNKTAVSYINRMGGTHSCSLSHLACQLWQWCLQHQIILSAEYLPGTSNIEADRQSRNSYHRRNGC